MALVATEPVEVDALDVDALDEAGDMGFAKELAFVEFGVDAPEDNPAGPVEVVLVGT